MARRCRTSHVCISDHWLGWSAYHWLRRSRTTRWIADLWLGQSRTRTCDVWGNFGLNVTEAIMSLPDTVPYYMDTTWLVSVSFYSKSFVFTYQNNEPAMHMYTKHLSSLIFSEKYSLQLELSAAVEVVSNNHKLVQSDSANISKIITVYSW